MGDRSLIHSIAVQLVTNCSNEILSAMIKQKFSWPENTGQSTTSCNPQYLYTEVRAAVNQKIHKLRPETLGQIADQATNLYNVHCGAWLDINGTGRELLREIAITGIVSEMASIISERAAQK